METFDYGSQFERIKRDTVDALARALNIDGKFRQVRVNKIWVDDHLDAGDWQSQHEAVRNDETWGVPVYASLDLVDRLTGKVLSQAKRLKVATLPKGTELGSFIINGKHYQVHNQLRRMPGVYVTQQRNRQLKTDVNIASKPFSIELDSGSGVFYLRKDQGRQPLYPLLSQMGISDGLLARAWGPELLDKQKAWRPNQAATSVKKLGQSFMGKSYDSPEAAAREIRDYLEKARLSPDATERTLGERIDRVTPDVLVRGARALLSVARGERPLDDRQSIEFKRLLSVADFLRERMVNDQGAFAPKLQELRRKIEGRLNNRASPPTQIGRVVTTNGLTPIFENFFTQTDLAHTPEQTNPLHILNGLSKVTIMGEGGVRSEHAIKEEERMVHPSHLGFLDPIHTPECFSADTEVFTSRGWKHWPSVTEEDLIACRVNGQLQFHKPEKLYAQHYRGPMYGVRTGKIAYLVTPNHRVLCRPYEEPGKSIWQIKRADEVYGKARMFTAMHLPYLGEETEWFELPRVKGGNATRNVGPIRMRDWAAFMGWFLSEGHFEFNERGGRYKAGISQSRSASPEECQLIERMLNRLPWRWNYGGSAYVITSKQLAAYLRQFGYCHEKFIPEYFFEAAPNVRYTLMDALLLGDGRINSYRSNGTSYRQRVLTTTSRRLAEDFERLAIGLGHSVRTGRYPDQREERYLDVLEVRILRHDTRAALPKKGHHFVEDYDGMVYCATVPGGLLLVRRGETVPIWSGNSSSIGSVLMLPVGAAKGANNDLRARFYDPKAKTYVHLSPAEIGGKVLAFPDQFQHGKFVDRQVKAMVRGEIQYVDADKVDVVLPSGKQAFSISSNTIPFLPSDHASRGLMATKMLEQAIPLVEREAPRVQVQFGPGTIEEHIGRGFSIRAKADGVVDAVTPASVRIRTKDGAVEQPLYQNFPLNTKSFLHATPRVKVGQAVKEGDLVADSNFTDGGTLAIGRNLRAAYIPYLGKNFEDGIVITESAAKKLTSEHLYQFAEDVSKDRELSAETYAAWRAGDLTRAQRAKLGDDGVVKQGQIVEKGDPLWVGVKDSRTDPDSIMMAKLRKMPAKRAFKQTWDNDVPGEVVDVVKANGTVKVYIKAREPAQIGDKLTNRHGGKGIITAILPDGEAPRDGAGRPVDILLNAFGVPTRMNVGQLHETAVAKIAEKTGKPYVVENFSGENYPKKVADDLAKHGLDDEEPLYDPHTGKPLGGKVHVGPQYFLKLSKQATSQFSARSEGKYDLNRAPLKGGEDGAKAIDLLTMYAMLAHGARANLHEMATYKATQNEPLWQWLQAGASAGLVKPVPAPTFAYKKFEAYLKGAGVDVERNGSKLLLQPMTDREVERLSSGAVKEPAFLRAKDLQKIKGGLVDPLIFGANEDRWGHFELAEPLPNPVFEEPIQRLANLSREQFGGLVRGQLYFDPQTSQWNTEERGLTGGAALKALLGRVDVDAQLKEWTDRAKKASTPAKLDEANKRLKYLSALKKLKLRPEEAYLQTKLPVLPPQFRPVKPLPDGSLSVQGANWLYRDLGLINNELKWQHSVPFIPESLKGELRENLYNGAKALAGLGDPIAFYPEQRRPKGFIEQIAGKPAKTGFFQADVLRRTQNLVARGTIIPEPKLGVDEIGLPEEMAWEVFKPFAVRQLVVLGRKPNDARLEVDKRTPAARAALEAVMRDRPVLLNRAPSLHKFSIMAFRPKITAGNAIKIPPLVVKGFNADFDGDAMTVHVPLLPDAVEEAKRMFPSRNLYNPGTGSIVIAPQNEAALGLYLMSQDPKKRHEVLSALPEALRGRFQDTALDKPGLTRLLHELADQDPVHYGKVVDKLKELGDRHAYEVGFTVGQKDLKPHVPEKETLLADTDAKVRQLFSGKLSPEKRAAAVELVRRADEQLTDVLPKRLGEQGNRLHLMVASGARGNLNQVKQIVVGPVLTDDHHGRAIPIPVTKSFAEGLPFSEYWQTAYGARRVAIDKQLRTQEPGAFNKDIMAAVSNNVISSPDCKTTHGIQLSVATQGRDLEDRYLAKDVRVGPTVVAHAGDLVTPSLLNTLREQKVRDVEVRSPLTCTAPKGTCARCYGLHESGELPPIGENVGVISGQALSEPLTQMTLRTFHSGGASGSRGIISGYEKIDKMLKMPRVLPDRATLAKLDGKVEKIEPDAGGLGHHVWVGDQEHFVPKNLVDGEVKVGRAVKRGDALSLGVIAPDELQRLKGMLPAMNYVADQIQGAYKDQKVDLKRRAIETVLRSVANTTRILDPGESHYLPGDIAPHSVVEAFNRQTLGKRAIKDAVGQVLREEVGHLKAGTPLDEAAVHALERAGKHEVLVGPRPIAHQPFLKGIDQIPLLRDDWMAQLGYERLKKAIVHGAARAAESDLHDYSPIPAFAYGAEFGQGTEGRY
jgi:DNA-directed RNA polymerase subunit beta'